MENVKESKINNEEGELIKALLNLFGFVFIWILVFILLEIPIYAVLNYLYPNPYIQFGVEGEETAFQYTTELLLNSLKINFFATSILLIAYHLLLKKKLHKLFYKRLKTKSERVFEDKHEDILDSKPPIEE